MWLLKEAHGKATFGWIFGCVKFNFVYMLIAMWFLNHIGVTIPPVHGVETLVAGGFIALLWRAPNMLLEDIVYRSPLALLVRVNQSLGMILVCSLALSVMFALAHGSAYHILIEGVHGMAYSLLFLKCGGWQSKIVKPLACVFAAHFYYDVSLYIFEQLF